MYIAGFLLYNIIIYIIYLCLVNSAHVLLLLLLLKKWQNKKTKQKTRAKHAISIAHHH